MKLTHLIAVAMLCPTVAAAQLYECTTKSHGLGGWIPPKIFVEVNKDATKASAIDGYIKQVHGKHIPVSVKRQSGEKVQLSWKLRGVETRNAGTGILSHTFILDRATGQFRMRGILHGADNRINGRGTCVKR